jgi:hypothetical protein
MSGKGAKATVAKAADKDKGKKVGQLTRLAAILPELSFRPRPGEENCGQSLLYLPPPPVNPSAQFLRRFLTSVSSRPRRGPRHFSRDW